MKPNAKAKPKSVSSLLAAAAARASSFDSDPARFTGSKEPTEAEQKTKRREEKKAKTATRELGL
jgi:hypothetical protein